MRRGGAVIPPLRDHVSNPRSCPPPPYMPLSLFPHTGSSAYGPHVAKYGERCVSWQCYINFFLPPFLHMLLIHIVSPLRCPPCCPLGCTTCVVVRFFRERGVRVVAWALCEAVPPGAASSPPCEPRLPSPLGRPDVFSPSSPCVPHPHFPGHCGPHQYVAPLDHVWRQWGETQFAHVPAPCIPIILVLNPQVFHPQQLVLSSAAQHPMCICSVGCPIPPLAERGGGGMQLVELFARMPAARSPLPIAPSPAQRRP